MMFILMPRWLFLGDETRGDFKYFYLSGSLHFELFTSISHYPFFYKNRVDFLKKYVLMLMTNVDSGW